MSRSIEEIKKEVRSLRVSERDRLLRHLIADLDRESEADIEQMWLQESKRRVKELQEGLVVAVPAAEVMRRARSRLRRGS